MIKKIFLLLAIVSMTFGVTFAAPNLPVEQSEKILTSSVFDNTGIFTANQIQSLTEKIHSVEQRYGVKIGVNFLQTIGNRDVDMVANSLLRQNYGDGQNGGIVLLVVMDTRSWNIALDAKMTQRIENYRDVAYLNDGFMDKLHNDNFVGAADTYVENVGKLLNYYEEHGTRFDRSEQFNPMALAAAILISLILGFAIRSWLIGSMSNVRHANEATDYLRRDSVRMTEERDTYLFTNVSRRAKASGNNSSSGGRSSGGGSSGGGHF